MPSVPSEHGRSDAYGSYLSPCRGRRVGELLGPNRAGGATPNFFEPPSPLSWGESIAPPVDEAASAQEARADAAQRLARRNRPVASEQTTAPGFAAGSDADMPGFRERTRLNLLDLYYRGTLLGAARLASLAHLAATPDGPGIRPEIKRVRDDLRREYRQITDDLARYDGMPSLDSAGGFGAAVLGQLGGGMLSPESWLGSAPRVRLAVAHRQGRPAARRRQRCHRSSGARAQHQSRRAGRLRPRAHPGRGGPGHVARQRREAGHRGARPYRHPLVAVTGGRDRVDALQPGAQDVGGIGMFANPQLSTTSIGPYLPSRWDINEVTIKSNS